MRRRMEDGSPVPDDEWHANLRRLLDEWCPGPRPGFHSGLSVRQDDGVVRTVGPAAVAALGEGLGPR
ncbi:hypothetical protein ACFYOA_00275 [Streptomyces iakyrus]|uniref:hypothetical protein n=1 Tax=Streptomyces iakyrus TaxID=68219 RepID=UPI00367ECA6A